MTCSGCGARVVGAVPLTWTQLRSVHGESWLCDVCTRRELSSIEARLDPGWDE
ncbi:MAG: hypothetical protein NVSMB13_18150 [Mycobacteriales bacterium]